MGQSFQCKCSRSLWEHRGAEQDRNFPGCGQVGQSRSCTQLVSWSALLLTTCPGAENMESEQTHEMFTETFVSE